MTQLYIVTIPASPEALDAILDSSGVEASADLHPVAANTLLSLALGDLAPSNFLWTNNHGVCAYFDVPAETVLEQARRRLSADELEQWGLLNIRSAAVPDRWRTNHPHEFAMRVPPIPQVHAPDSGNRTDVEIVTDRDQAYESWLTGQIAPWECAALDFAWLVGHRPRTAAERRVNRPEIGTAYLTGGINVTDPGKFIEMLRQGIGRQRELGYGMMLLDQHCRLIA